MTAAQKKMAKMKTSKLELPGRGDVCWEMFAVEAGEPEFRSPGADCKRCLVWC